MTKRIIRFSPPDVGADELEEIADAVRSGWITTGPKTKELEREVAELCGAPRAVCLSSATAAEEMNLRILGIGEGDEVLVPAYTYTATASAAIHVGATVKFIDSVRDGWEMDYDMLEDAVTGKTKAIIPVDLGGIPCDYDAIFDIVERKRAMFTPSGTTELGGRIQRSLGRVAVVADAAHALGAARRGVPVGSIADFSSFSFHAVKNFTTAEGGASVWRHIDGVDDGEIYRQMQLYSLHGQSKDALAKTKLGAWEYDILGTWYKCNMTDIAAAMGLAQMRRYPGMLARRRSIIERYDAVCDALGLHRLAHVSDKYKSAGHLYAIRIPGADISVRNGVIEKMAEAGVACNVHYKPLPMMTAYRELGWDIADFPNAYAFFENEITLPLHTCLSDDDVEYVAEQLRLAVGAL